MAVTVRKYNPGFLSDVELVESFCVRTAEFETIVESLRECDGSSSAHTIVIGPRGSGKTHLLLRVAVGMGPGVHLAEYFPIVFSEESYEVSTHGEFWLECLGRLAEQAPLDERSALRLTHEDLRTVRDDGILAERCLGAILDFSDRHGRRLALVVENLNMLLPAIADPDVGWKLRRTLQTEPRITLLGSATSRFEEIDHPEQPLYDIFRAIALRPLNTEECGVLWSRVTGQPPEEGMMRPLEILTGGSPRMIAMVAGFRTTDSFSGLMNNLLNLIDDHTEFFKSHIDALPAQERRVYLALARLWRPSTTREIADQARIDTNRCSAFLRRLIERGAVSEEGGTPRRRQYYLTERLFNIYYLLRRPSGEGQVVRALIQFMVCCYSPSQLLNLGLCIAREYRTEDAHIKLLQELAFADLLQLPEMADMRSALLTDSSVVASFASTDTPEIAEKIATEMVLRAHTLASNGAVREAILKYTEVMRQFADGESLHVARWVALALMQRGLLIGKSGMVDEEIADYDRIYSKYGQLNDPALATVVDAALLMKGDTLTTQGRHTEAIDLMRDVLRRAAEAGRADTSLGAVLVLSEALSAEGDKELALAQVNFVLKICDELRGSELAKLRAFALVQKGLLLRDWNQTTISESEAESMLVGIAELGDIPVSGIDVLIDFCAVVGPGQALDVIQSSPALELMVPLVTALKQELGEQPRVAKEVHEVAGDIRRRIADLQQSLRARNHK